MAKTPKNKRLEIWKQLTELIIRVTYIFNIPLEDYQSYYWLQIFNNIEKVIDEGWGIGNIGFDLGGYKTDFREGLNAWQAEGFIDETMQFDFMYDLFYTYLRYIETNPKKVITLINKLKKEYGLE